MFCLTGNATGAQAALNSPLTNARYTWLDGKTSSMLVPEMASPHPSAKTPYLPPDGVSFFSTRNETAAAGGWFPLNRGILTDGLHTTGVGRNYYHAGVVGSDVLIDLGEMCSLRRLIVREQEPALRNLAVYAWDDTTQRWVLTWTQYDRVQLGERFTPKPLNGALRLYEDEYLRAIAIPLDVETHALRINLRGEATRVGLREVEVWGDPAPAATSRVPHAEESRGATLVYDRLGTLLPSDRSTGAAQLIPKPRRRTPLSGTCAPASIPWTIVADPGLEAVADALQQDLLLEHPEISLENGTASFTLRLGAAPADALFAEQAYTLEITPTTITFTGPTPQAVFYAVQTLHGLLLATRDGTLACERIEDWPETPIREVFGSEPPTPNLIKALARFKLNQYKFADNNWLEHLLGALQSASAQRFVGLVPMVDFHASVRGTNPVHDEWAETAANGAALGRFDRANACPGRPEVWADFTARLSAAHAVATAWIDVVMDEMGAPHRGFGAHWNEDATCTIEHLDDVGVLTPDEVAEQPDPTAHLPRTGDLLLYTFRHIVEVVHALTPPGDTPKRVMTGGTTLRDFTTSSGSLLGAIASESWGDQMGFWIWEGGSIPDTDDDPQRRVTLLAMPLSPTWQETSAIRPNAPWAHGVSFGIGFREWSVGDVVVFAAGAWSGVSAAGTTISAAASWKSYADARQFFADYSAFEPSHLAFSDIAASGGLQSPLSRQPNRVFTPIALGSQATAWLPSSTSRGFGDRGPNYGLQSFYDHAESSGGTFTTVWETLYQITPNALQVWNRRHYQRYSPDGALLTVAPPTERSVTFPSPITAHGLLMLHALDERCQRQYSIKRELVGQYIVHYEDDSYEPIPLKYAINIANYDGLNTWWDYSPRDLAMSRARLAWAGQFAVPESPKSVFATLYEMEWRNPFPHKRIRAIELRASTLPSGTSIGCFGITAITLPSPPAPTPPAAWSFKLRRSADLQQVPARGTRLPLEEGLPGDPATAAEADLWLSTWDTAWTWSPPSGGRVQLSVQPGYRPMTPRRAPGPTEIVANIETPWSRVAHVLYDNTRGLYSDEVPPGTSLTTAESTTLALRIRFAAPRRLAGLRLVGHYQEEEAGINTDRLPQVLHLQVLTQRPGQARFWRAGWKIAVAPEAEPMWWVDLGDQELITLVLLSQWGSADRRGWALVELYASDMSSPPTPNPMLSPTWSSHWGSRWVPTPMPASPPPLISRGVVRADGPVVIPLLGSTLGRQDAVMLAGSVSVAPRQLPTAELRNSGFFADDRYQTYTSIQLVFPFDDVIGLRFPILWWERNPFWSLAVKWVGPTWDLRRFITTDGEGRPDASRYPPRTWWTFELRVGVNAAGAAAVIVTANGVEQTSPMPGFGVARLNTLLACMPATTTEGAICAMGRLELLRESTGVWEPLP